MSQDVKKTPLAWLSACISPACFWAPEHLQPSAWLEHAPFVFWLMEVLRPRLVVELGTHGGYSYFTFCQAVQWLQLGTRCYAIDTWKGDELAGFYGEEVYDQVHARNQRLYSAFSSLIRSSFDQALTSFTDGTIDLLHIDGRHFYDDVKHDFEAWRPKLSDRGVVLCHDTNVRERGFGVYKFWEEVRSSYPHFEFAHGHGLGALGVGRKPPDVLAELFLSGEREDAASQIRNTYARLGSVISLEVSARQQTALIAQQTAEIGKATSLELSARQQTALIAQQTVEIGKLRDQAAVADAQAARKRQALAERADEIVTLRQALGVRDAKISGLDQTLSDRNSEISALRQTLAERNAKVGSLNAAILALRASTSWRVTAPLRAAKRFLRRLAYSAIGYPLMLACRALMKRSRARLRNWRAVRVIARSGEFDRDWYLKTSPDVLKAGIDPVRHYVAFGAREGRDPSPSFSSRGYLVQNPDVAASGVNPLLHFIRHGFTEKKHFPNAYREIYLTQARYAGGALLPHHAPPILKSPPTERCDVKLVAYYLPQYHPIPENDEWWGKGFTEWRNVTRAFPLFVGHDQPRQPGELGYYDLRVPEIMRRQVDLAKLGGISAFCFHFYWFGGKRLLELPLENFLQNKDLDLKFCLCWANENWTRRWDGADDEIFIAQSHSAEDDVAFIRYLKKYFDDPRYLRIQGKPVLTVYRPGILPDAGATLSRWRVEAERMGLPGIYVIATNSFGFSEYRKFGFDALSEFPPWGISQVRDNSAILLYPDNESHTFSYSGAVKEIQASTTPQGKVFPGVMPGWDNTPRRLFRGTVFHGSTPALFYDWLMHGIARARGNEENERFVFINAWNEWAEGAYLEPDARYGYAYLQATHDAVCASDGRRDSVLLFVTHDCCANGAQFLALEIVRQLKSYGFELAIVALDGGKLYNDFAQVGRMINAKEAGAVGLQSFLADLSAEGARDAITSTVVSGSIVAQLKQLDFHVLSLVHELPGIIRDMGQGANVEAIARLSDKVVFPAEIVYRRFNEIAPVDADRAVIRHQGLLRRNPYKNRRAEAYRIIAEKHHLPVGTRIVLSVAYGDYRKGPDLLVEIAAHVLREQPSSIFIWVGDVDPKMDQRVIPALDRFGLRHKVLFVGFDREPLAYFAAASIYALSSREDPFPNVALESAEVGVPVVAFEGATGAGEFIVKHGGRLASYLDTRDFARQICELLDAPAAKASIGVLSLRQYTLDLLHQLNGFPRISVIVPNCNYQKHIKQRLDSIFQQSFPIYELIVLDDASTDNSVEAFQRYFRDTGNEARLIINERNSGSVFRQWHNGVTSCTGDLVWIAEADDVADAGFLSELAPAFDDLQTVLAFCQSKQIDENGKVLAENYLDYTKDVSDCWRASYVSDGIAEIGERLTVKNTIPNVSAVLFRRQALETAFANIGENLFAYKVAGDWLVYLRVLLQGKLYYNYKPLNLHRRHTNSVTKALDASNHFREICRLQEIARSLSAPSSATLAKANAYIEHLRDYFGIAETDEIGT